MEKQMVFVMIGVAAVFMIGILFLVSRSWRQVPTGKALIVKKMGAHDRVVFEGGAIVLPVVNQAEVIDISLKTFKVSCRGVPCADEAKADIDVTFYVRINHTKDDVLRVAQSLGCARASDHDTVQQLFVPKFVDAIHTVTAHMELAQLRTQRDTFKDQVIAVIGKDLNGFVLDDAAIDRADPADAGGYPAHDPDGRGRVEHDGTGVGDEHDVAKLRRDVDALQKQVAVLVEAWRKS